MNIKRTFLLNLFLITALFGSAQEKGTYNISNIAPGLVKNASVVIRNEDQVYDLKNRGSASYTYKTAVTILNKNGERASAMYQPYDKFSKVYNLKAALYDAKGNKIKDYKATDFRDVSAVDNGSMYADSRIRYLQFLYTDFPYTIEYSFSVDYSGIRYYPDWHPVRSWGYAVEKSNYTLNVPQNMSFKYLASKGLKIDSAKVKGANQYKWGCLNVAALQEEPLSTGMGNVTPWVSLAPNQFEFDNSKANIENWNKLGSWLFTLSNGMQELPDATKAKIQAIIKDAKTPKEKIGLLYNYLQSNTRYVSVQLGIGGYKPIAAEKVASVNYGDCKALSNFMKAMLEVAGIKSDLVVIGHNLPSLNADFASMTQANHMILCVPLGKDTTWLECTSQYVPPGYIGDGNSDKTVLLITEDGGKLVHTPVYTAANNYQKRMAKVNLDTEGSADVSIETNYANAQYEENLGMMLMAPADQRKAIMNSLSIPNMEISALSYTQPDKAEPLLKEKIGLKCSQLLTKGGDKFFITLNLLNRQQGAIVPVENRKTYFAAGHSYTDEDEIIYTIPKGYKVEFMPGDIVIESEFGKYAAKVVVKDNTLTYSRTKTMTNKVYPPEKYNDFVAFYKKIYQADKQKGILTKIE